MLYLSDADLSNAVSLNMISDFPVSIKVQEIDIESAIHEINSHIEVGRVHDKQLFISGIGHADTAKAVSIMLEMNIPANRVNIKLTRHDWMIVVQYVGPRLEEGIIQLPDDAKLKLFWVSIE